MYAHDWIDFPFCVDLVDDLSGAVIAPDVEGRASVRIFHHSDMDWLIDGISMENADGEPVDLNGDQLSFKLVKAAIERTHKDEIDGCVFRAGRAA